jgi:hypothetical protein
VKNEIKLLRSQEIYQDDEPLGVIQLGINVFNTKELPEFFDEVIDKWIAQRMQSVPHTKAMIVTIYGGLTSNEFRDYWAEYRENNEILDFFMKMMISADVLHIDGTVLLDKSSLI